MARRAKRRRPARGVPWALRWRAGVGRRRLLPVVALVVAVASLLAWTVIAGGTAGDTGAETVSATGDTGTETVGAAEDTDAETVSPARQAELLATGRRIVTPAEQRESAAALRLQTAQYGDGSMFDLAEERGNIVVLYLVAAWCSTCVPEAQALALIHQQYEDRGVRILVLDVDQAENEGHLAEFRERAGNGVHLWAMDVEFRAAEAYDVRSLDTTIFIDREGRIAYWDGSTTSYDVLAAVIEALS